MIVKLPFGRGTAAVDLRGLRVRPLEPKAPASGGDPGRLAAAALDAPLAGPPLTELARGRRRAVVVVPDATRHVALPAVLPEVLARLAAGGLTAGEVTVLVACGTHPAAPPARLGELLGPLPSGVTVLQHDSRDEAGLAVAGTLPDGRPVRLSRALLAADLVVTVGGVQHHYFAGFGGGPKMVFPGVAGYDEIQANHARVLERTGDGWRRHPGCEPGRLVANPVAEEIRAAAALRPPDLVLCLVAARDGSPAFAAAGPLEAAFPVAVERVRAWYEVAEGPFRLMVAGGGGHPADATLIQAHKALDAAARYLEPGGELLFVAALDAGAGSPEMEPFLADPRPQAILERLAGRWVQYGHTTLRLVEKTGRARIRLHSGLAPDLARRLGFEPVDDPADVVERWREAYPGVTVGVLPGRPVVPPPA